MEFCTGKCVGELLENFKAFVQQDVPRTLARGIYSDFFSPKFI